MKQAHTHTVDPTKDHHMINGQLVPVVARAADTRPRSNRPKPPRAAKKPKGGEAVKSPPSGS